MQLEDAGKEAKDDSDLELDPAETTRWGFRTKIWETQRENPPENAWVNPPLASKLVVWGWIYPTQDAKMANAMI